jgi:hypothetical protein
MPSQTWQIAVDLLFPNHFPMQEVDGVAQLPEQLDPQSRIPRQSRDLGDAIVFIAPGESSRVPGVEEDLRWEVATLTVRLKNGVKDASNAIDAAMPYLDSTVETLSFQMQCPLPIQRLEAIDLSGLPVVGESRALETWTGFATPTFRPMSVPMGSVVGRLVPDLAVELDSEDRRANRALDWYLKALSARFEADHFIFLWIAVEILAADSGLTVTEPYRPRCGHTISFCPECDAPTTKVVQGPSIRRFLTEGFGIEGAIAKRLWDARQMLHGAHAFDSKVMFKLPELSQHLRAVLVTALKPRLGLSEEEPPYAIPTGISISPHMGLFGTREVTEDDLYPLGKADS